MCKVFHSSLILHQEAGSSEPASCIFNTYKGLSQFLIETAPFLRFRWETLKFLELVYRHLLADTFYSQASYLHYELHHNRW
ncbi:hypothetical protein SAMN04490355_103553 [Pelosinus propionicus DSM 13327]|uniref:Uncharacterized protein n=2 Tax=Pelosinus propionicus DSM 13327 TaxID=1123291 RepID=A0A1I4MMV0_9FIRM|nr:hypothetical protein SAMN04490355_103553 [Pelosinus propionicus DSM 13327]